ncbi:MAG: carboxypeptidase regulatory-like domain-containing protein, partial [Planctomycetota bacterium]
HETTIDASGRFSFKEAPIVGKEVRLVLAATKPGFASVIRYLRQESDRSDISLKIKSKTAALSGTITDADGNPIANALVSIQGDKYPIPGVRMAKTDRHGRYTITDLTPWNTEATETYDPKTKTGTRGSRCFFRITHEDYPTTRGAYTQIPQEVDITLLPPAIVEGQVVDLVTGEPLANVGVGAQGVARSGYFTTKTDADGNYELRMTNDHYNIWAVAPERMPLAIKALKVTQGQRLMGMDIRMTRGGYVVGKVIDPQTNQPVNGSQTNIQIGHHGPARPMTGAAVTSIPVKGDGTYRLHVAAGRNYVYLMSGNSAPVYLKVGDGQTVKHDFTIGTISKISIGADPDQLLRRKIMKETRREDEKQVTLQKNKPEAATLRQNTSVGQLLTELEDLNTGSERFSDKWANQMRKIVALGPDVVPQLVAELDRTSNDMMLRCLGFMLRAIGDKRAVPGLIRAIPKTLIRPGSDMGLRIEGTDLALLKFMQQHDRSPNHKGNEYGFGRPVREIFGALHTLTGQDFGDQELYHIFLNANDFPSQKHAKAALFHRVAERWVQWWDQHGRELTDDPTFYKVNLSPLPDLAPTDSVSSSAPLKTDNGTGNWILQSLRRAPGGLVFYDLDTGRAASLPERWRDKKLSEDQLREIQEWAAKQGYDMMGDEIEGEKEKSLFVLRPIGLSTWELPKARWKDPMKRTSMDALKVEGQPNKQDLLVSFDAETNKAKPLDTATFFYITREGTPGILYVGIEVHDDSLKPGGFSTSDNELNPVAFRKGRRFALSRLVKK